MEVILFILWFISMGLFFMGGNSESTEATVLGFVGLVITSYFLFF